MRKILAALLTAFSFPADPDLAPEVFLPLW